MKQRFTRQLFYTSTLFYTIGSIIILHQYFTQYPDMTDDFLYVNLWMFFLLFGTVFLVFTLLSMEIKNKKKRV